MVSHRSIGTRTLALACQLVMVTFSFWAWLYIWQNALFTDRYILKRYLLYAEFLLIGILFSWGRKNDARGQHHEWVGAIRQSTRQALFGLFCIFFVVFALQDAAVSRS